MADITDHDVTVDVLMTSPTLIRYHLNDMNLMLYRLDRSLINYEKNEEFKKHIRGNGVYFYIESQKPVGIDEDSGNLIVQPLKVYIGEGEDVHDRYRTHGNDEWSDWETLVFVWNDELSLSLRRNLEKRFIAQARQHGDLFVVNKKAGSNIATPRVERKWFKNLMDLIPWMLKMAGYDFLMPCDGEPSVTGQQSADSEIAPSGVPVFHFYIREDPDIARGYPTENGFVVMAGSKAKPAQHYLSGKDRSERDRLVKDGILVRDVFVKDWLADSHRRASHIITGTTGGSQDDRWKTKDGVSIQTYLSSMDEADDS